jgi:uncharacterized protein YggE
MNGSKSLAWKAAIPAGLVIVSVVLLAVGCAGGGPIGGAVTAASNASAPTNSITVTGYGEAYGAPDVAYVMLGVDTVNEDIGEAVSQSNQITEQVRDAMLELGIAPEDLQTANFGVWREDVYAPETGLPTGEARYHVTNMIQIVVRELSQAANVIDAGLDAGANSVGGLSFGIDDTTLLENEARVDAVADARARAEALAEALGVTLGDPIIAIENLGYGGVPVARAEAAMGMGGGGGAPPISEGQLAVSLQVTVTYSITP